MAGALGANGVLLVVQVVAGVFFGSLALLADSAHQLTDVIGLALALVAHRLSKRSHTSDFTWGFRRTEVLGALANAVLLLASAGWILLEAYRRAGDPPELFGWGVVAVALVGLVVNGTSAGLLQRVAGDSLNLRGAVIHLAADAAGSGGVLLAGLADVWFDTSVVDVVVSVAIALLVVWTGFSLLADTTRVLLEGTPAGLDIDSVVSSLTAHPDVDDVHHLHVWSIDSEHAALSAHVVIGRETLHEAQQVSEQLQHLLEHDHGIAHATLAVECHACDDATHAL